MAMAGAPPIGGPPPPAPQVKPAPTTINTFKPAALAQPSPYGQDYNPMYQFWSGNGPHTPAQLSTKAVSSRLQWFLAFHQGIQSYIVLHDPFVYPAAPGLNHPRSNQTIWVINNIETNGTTLSLVDQPANLFHVTAAVTLPPDAVFTTLMAAAATGTSEVAQVANPPPMDGYHREASYAGNIIIDGRSPLSKIIE
jgi:hypothetical protein